MKRRLGLLLSFFTCVAQGQGECIDAASYQRSARNYADLSTRFDPAPMAQQLLDLLSRTRESKLRLQTCQADECSALQKSYEDELALREALAGRLNLALGMQEYLNTLKLRLERPHCEK